MRRQSISIIASILLAAFAGCQSAPPIRTVSSSISTDKLPLVLEYLETNSTAKQLPPSPALSSPLVNFEEELSQETSSAIADESIESDSLTLADFEGIAFQNNPTLSAAAARIQAASGKQIQAGLYPNPVIGYHANEVGNFGTAGGQGGFVRQKIITGGKLQLDQAIAGKQVDEAHFRWHAQEQRVLSDVRIRFYETRVAQQRVQLTKELVQIGDNLVQAVNTLIANRLATENDLLQAEIRADNARILYDNAQNESLEAWRRLSAVVGVPNIEVSQLTGELGENLPNFDWDSSFAQVLTNHPELNAAKARVDQFSYAVARARKEPLPDLDVFVSVRHHNVSSDEVANIQVGIPLPIFNKNQGNIQTAQSQWIAATNNVARIELDLQDKFAVTFRRYANSQQQVNRYRERILPKAQRSLDLVTVGFEKGQVKYLTLLTAQQTFVEVSLAHLDATRELRVAEAMIDGQLLTGSLAGTK
ncbi:MAG: TolC family protein [Pirellulales bacterium]